MVDRFLSFFMGLACLGIVGPVQAGNCYDFLERLGRRWTCLSSLCIGRGVETYVFKVQQETTGKVGAFKVWRQEISKIGFEHLTNEVQMLQKFDHPRIVKLLAYSLDRQKPFILTEHAEKGVLCDLFVDGFGMSRDFEATMRTFRQVVEAVLEIHSKNYVHTNINSRKVVLDANGDVKIVNFGLARLAGTVQRFAQGTPLSIDPEMIRQKSNWNIVIHKANDVWALGILLYEMFHGHVPFFGRYVDDTYAAAEAGDYKIRSDIGERTALLMTKMLQDKQSDRIEAQDILREIDGILAEKSLDVIEETSVSTKIRYQPGSFKTISTTKRLLPSLLESGSARTRLDDGGADDSARQSQAGREQVPEGSTSQGQGSVARGISEKLLAFPSKKKAEEVQDQSSGVPETSIVEPQHEVSAAQKLSPIYPSGTEVTWPHHSTESGEGESLSTAASSLGMAPQGPALPLRRKPQAFSLSQSFDLEAGSAAVRHKLAGQSSQVPSHDEAPPLFARRGRRNYSFLTSGGPSQSPRPGFGTKLVQFFGGLFERLREGFRNFVDRLLGRSRCVNNY